MNRLNKNMPRKQTLDDIVFENRNKEYGSYHLRKSHLKMLAIGFISSLIFILLLVSAYSLYLNKAGDETIYMYSASPYLKNAEGSLMSTEELESYMGRTPEPDKIPDETPVMQRIDPLSFRITENPSLDTFKPQAEFIQTETTDGGYGLLNDSTAFGGVLAGDGTGLGGKFDRIPEFPGGDATKYVERNLRYPALAIKQKIHGVVIVSFVVNKTGHVVDVKVEHSVNPIIDEEAVKTIKSMPPWKPGMLHGRPINFLFRMPINFIPLS